MLLTSSVLFFSDPYGTVANYPSPVGGGYGSSVSPTSNGHFAMPPCPPVAALPGGAGTVVGRGSVIQAANCYQPNGSIVTSGANLNDLSYYMDFGAPAAMYGHQKAVGNKSCSSGKKPKKYGGGVGRPAAVGSPGVVPQSSCPTGPKRKSREGEYRLKQLIHVWRVWVGSTLDMS